MSFYHSFSIFVHINDANHVTLGHMSAIIARLDHIEWVQRYEEHNE